MAITPLSVTPLPLYDFEGECSVKYVWAFHVVCQSLIEESKQDPT